MTKLSVLYALGAALASANVANAVAVWGQCGSIHLRTCVSLVKPFVSNFLQAVDRPTVGIKPATLDLLVLS